MASGKADQRSRAATLRGAVDEVFGRWPAWPWSILGLIVAGGIVGLAVGSALRDPAGEHRAALGAAACAGYGIVAAALLSLLPRLAKLTVLGRDVHRRPAAVDASWWPLTLLGPALAATPTLRRTPQEFRAAVDTAGGQARSILADRLWPAWVTAFVAPVLGLITAWQNGAKVQLRLKQGEDFASVFPAFIAEVSPPMMATITAALALMVAIVATDQWTKGLLRRWCGIVEAGDGDHPAVLDAIGKETFRDAPEAPRPAAAAVAPKPTQPPKPTHHLDPDELDAMWRQSDSRDN